MAINITKVVNEINSRLLDSGYSDVELTQLLAASSRIENSGINALTYRSTGHLPSTADSDRIGSIAYVAADNVFGDSSGRFYYASTRDSGWIAITTLQDSDEGAIEAPSGGEAASAIQGTSYGYEFGGSSPQTDTIQKYSYISDGNASDVANLSAPIWQMTSSYNGEAGYSQGGFLPVPGVVIEDIQKHDYAAGTDATDVGTITGGKRYGAGSSGPSYGYQFAGMNTAGTTVTTIFKFPFASGGTASSVGDVSAGSQYAGSNASETNAYVHNVGGTTNTIEKVPFAADGNTTDVGDLLETADGRGANGLLSDVSGGYGYDATAFPAPKTYEIQRYSFASDGNATDYSDLLTDAWISSGSASTASGYVSGGLTPPPATYLNVIQKFPFASAGDTTDVGDTLAARGYAAGTAY